MRVGRRLAIAGLLIGLAACAAVKDPLDELAVGEGGRVVHVLDGDAGFEEAKRNLKDMVLGREVELRQGGLTRDRYDRALAHVVTTDALGPRLWLNAEVVKKGGAQVRFYPDTATANAPLLALEAAARANGRGLWDDGVWPSHNAAALPPEAERFQIVRGLAVAMQGSEERFAVCDVALKRSALILEIGKSAAELCQLPNGTPLPARFPALRMARSQPSAQSRKARLRLTPRGSARPSSGRRQSARAPCATCRAPDARSGARAP